ncbi:hypothetical protein HBI47_110220 [Parastagonospora nodorum]|nr:hypothetical protein HBI47_110220 [Parastagonospora nodorum]
MLLDRPYPCHHRSFSHIACLCNDAGNLHNHPRLSTPRAPSPRHPLSRGGELSFLFPRRGVDMTCFSVF